MNELPQISSLYWLERPERIPLACIDTGFSSIEAGYSLTDAYGNPDKSLEARLRAEERYGFIPVPQIIRHTILAAHDFGGDVRLPSGPYDQAMKILSHPVKNESDAWRLAMPDPKTAGGVQTAMRFSKLQHQRGLTVWFHHRSPFTMAANICGMERFARWMHREPKLCDHLIEMALGHVFNVLGYWVDTFGEENIAVYNSSPMESNQLISPGHFERFALPGHIKYIEKLKGLGIRRYFFHICGDQCRNLPYLSRISGWPHPAVISIGHEVALDKAAGFFPDDIIYGNIDPMVIQFGAIKEVYDLCRMAIETGKRIKGGFILAPGCDLPLYPPPENVVAMTKALADFGCYA